MLPSSFHSHNYQSDAIRHVGNNVFTVFYDNVSVCSFLSCVCMRKKKIFHHTVRKTGFFLPRPFSKTLFFAFLVMKSTFQHSGNFGKNNSRPIFYALGRKHWSRLIFPKISLVMKCTINSLFRAVLFRKFFYYPFVPPYFDLHT